MTNQNKSQIDAKQQVIIDKINAEEKAKYQRLLEETNRKYLEMMDNLNI